MLTPSLRVINSRNPKLCFRRPRLFLWFSIVFYNNYGGDSKTLFTNFIFLVRHPVAISVVTICKIKGKQKRPYHAKVKLPKERERIMAKKKKDSET